MTQTLTRKVRFAVNPFIEKTEWGHNPYSGSPPGTGLAIYLCLSIEVEGPVDQDTGFIINIVDLDRIIRQNAIADFNILISEYYRLNRHIDFLEIVNLLEKSGSHVRHGLPGLAVRTVTLELNPYRTIFIKSGEEKMYHFSEKFEFSATHKLWNEKFDDEKNFELFGKCANPSGHGHNYVLEVTLNCPRSGRLNFYEYQHTVNSAVIDRLDHKNLNADVEYFKKTPASMENIAVFAWEKLKDKFGQNRLESIKVWETDKAYCCYRGQ